MTLTEEIMQVAFGAPDERKREALRVLRGEEGTAGRHAETEPYLTLREVGRRLGVSACSLWRWQVPGHEMGGRRRFRMSEVEAYLGSEEFKEKAEELREGRREASGQ